MLPRGWDRRTIVLLTFAFLFAISTKPAAAQAFDLDRDRVPMAELNGLMRFHTGDDPRWADPNFDDSSWPLINSDRDWGQQGYQGYSGMAWYRFRVALPNERRQLAIYVQRALTSYQVFAQGRLVGQKGHFPAGEEIFGGADRSTFLIPSDSLDPKRPLVVAFRIWHSPVLAKFFGGGLLSPPRIGDADTLEDFRSLKIRERVWQLSSASYQFVIEILAGLAALILFSMRPKEREYFWFGAYEILNGIGLCIHNYRNFHINLERDFDLAETMLSCVALLCFLAFLFKVLRAQKNTIYRIIVGLWIVNTCLYLPYQLRIPMSLPLILLNAAVGTASFALMFGLLMKGVRNRNKDAMLLLPTFGLCTLGYLLEEILGVLAESGHPHLLSRLDLNIPLVHWPFPISSNDILNTLVDLSLFGILILRFARSRRDEERFKSELEAARTVQQILIPEEIPAIPGLALECVYKPAGQVGGDFFQILPVASPEGAGAFKPLNPPANEEGFSPGHLERTSALIVIGDVSGKGMPAAMAVSLLVGTVRTLAHYTQSPGEILTAMNQRMLGRSKHGFTTCLVLRLDPDGTATVANAGHLAPYNGSREVPVESGLPLGLAADVDYTESTFHLDPGAELTLLTDGVAEARAKTGELFGFERTASIATLSAQHIAATAQAFGQQDDITVLKIRRQPIPESAPASVASTTLSPSPA